MTEAQTKLAELKAANVIRRVIQKIRLATPDNLEALEAEVFDCMEQNISDLGSQHEKVQAEVEKALDMGRQRVTDLLEKEARESEMAARPKALIEEIRALQDSLTAQFEELAKAAHLEPGVKPQDLTEDEAKDVHKLVEASTEQVKEFSTECVARAKEIKENPLPETIKVEWTKLAHEIVEVKKKGELLLMRARAAVKKATEATRKEELEARKAGLKKKVQDASASVPAAEQFVISAEVIVEPFIKGKRRTESEMVPLCEKAEAAAAEAKSQVEAAAQDLKTSDIGAADIDGEEDDLLKKDIEAFLQSEAKRPRIRLGQLERRVQRVSNIVTTYKKELRTARNKLIYKEMRDSLIEQVKGNGESKAVDECEPQIKSAEKEVEPFLKARSMTLPMMRELETKVQMAMKAARDALDAASFSVCPIDDSLDDDLKRKLRAAVAPHVKRPFIRLGQLDRRMGRIVNMLHCFRKDMTKKISAEHAQVRVSVLRLLRHHLSENSLEGPALFDKLCGGDAGLSEAKFVAFFETVSRTVPKAGSSEATETLSVSEADLVTFFSDALKKGETTLSKAGFVSMTSQRMKVVKPTTLTTNLGIGASKILRAVRAGEAVEVLEGPVREDKAGVMRVRVRCAKDGKEGWVSIAGNAGSVFLTEA